MAGAGVIKLTGRRIENRAARGNEVAGAFEVVVKKFVELAQKLSGARRDQSLRQEHRARLGHEQGCADAVAGHVADQAVYAMTISSARKIAEIIAAHRLRGNAAACIAHAAHRQRIFRQQRSLDLLGDIHVRARHRELDFRLAGLFLRDAKVPLSRLQRRGHGVERWCEEIELAFAAELGNARAELAGGELPGPVDEGIDAAENEPSARPRGDHGQDCREDEPGEIANEAAIDIRERDRLRRSHRRVQVEAGDQRGVGPQSPDALRVVGFEKAALSLVEYDVEDLRFGQRLADPIAGIGHAGEHRSIAIGHHHDGARRKLDVRESRREPIQVLHHEDDSVELSRRADQRIAIADRGKLRDAPDLIIADGEVAHLEGHLEVRAIRDIDGRPERKRATD